MGLKTFRWAIILAGLIVTKKGKCAPRSEAPVIVYAPHSSYWDAAATFFIPTLTSYVAKAGAGTLPIIGSRFYWSSFGYVFLFITNR